MIQNLEVESKNKLHRTTTRIVSRRNVLVSRGDQAKVCRAIIRCLQTEVGPREFWIVNCGVTTNQEVDVVECIQQLDAKLEVPAFRKPDLLDQTHIETNKAWPFKNQ